MFPNGKSSEPCREDAMNLLVTDGLTLVWNENCYALENSLGRDPLVRSYWCAFHHLEIP